jgi:hypothetical protein
MMVAVHLTLAMSQLAVQKVLAPTPSSNSWGRGGNLIESPFPQGLG